MDTNNENGCLISVIIPIYNVEKFIERCARSLFEQTMDDVEFIFVDDASPDHSIEVLKKTILDYPNLNNSVKILHHDINLGLPKARETGFKNAIGKYIIHCDSDDWVEPNYCSCLYERALETGADIVSCLFYYSDTDRETIANDNVSYLHYSLHVWNKLVRRSLYKHIIWPIESMAEDQILMLQLYYYANNIDMVDKPLYHYFLNPFSITGVKTENFCLRKCQEVQENITVIESFLCREKIDKKYRNDLFYLKFMAKSQLTPLLKLKKYRRMWRELYKEINISFLFSRIGISLKLIFVIRLLGISYQRYGK